MLISTTEKVVGTVSTADETVSGAIIVITDNQIGADIIDLFNQRPRTIGGIGAQVEALFTGGVGAQSAAFGIAGNPNFLNYDSGTFTGRTVTLRAKFIF